MKEEIESWLNDAIEVIFTFPRNLNIMFHNGYEIAEVYDNLVQFFENQPVTLWFKKEGDKINITITDKSEKSIKTGALDFDENNLKENWIEADKEYPIKLFMGSYNYNTRTRIPLPIFRSAIEQQHNQLNIIGGEFIL